jgi:competence protein ComEC
MQQPDRPRSRSRTWDEERRAAPFVWPRGSAATLDLLKQHLARWAVAEVAPGRLAPWIAVAFGFGIVLYFAAAREPVWWAPLGAVGALLIAAILTRRSPWLFPATVGALAAATGFAIATLRTERITHPVLAAPVSSVAVAGFVETREERERSDRVVVRVHRMDDARGQTLERVRVSVRKGTAPAVGAFVEFKARLSPPLQPLRPGGYDFARDLYFQRIGASGFVLGSIKTVTPPAEPGWRLRFAAAVDHLRDTMDKRIRAVLPGDLGSIASALITGKRDAISAPVNDAMYVSSLAHVLSISGYHMAVVAGIVFFFMRALLALSPRISDHYPIKKWAALAALIAAGFYLVLSGAEVATQRSFIMIAIVLIGVMVDRQALTLRTLTVAALAVLLMTPEAIVHPSFQMSFAATLALVAGYQYGLPWKADAHSSLGTRMALWGGREIVGLILASIVAGLATTPYAAFHFHRLAPYGTLANLAAMPVVSAFVMPMGILGVLAMPFGYDQIFWEWMGLGLSWMTAVALWVTSLPGAVGHIHAFGIGTLLLGTFGLVVLCLLRTPLRLAGGAIIVVSAVLAMMTPRASVFVAQDGSAVAARGPDGRLAIAKAGSDTFAIREWLAADGDARTANDPSLTDGVRCDPAGCILPLANGEALAFATSLEALAEDCRRVAIVVTAREAQGACRAHLIDRKSLQTTGALALTGDAARGVTVRATREPGYRRPWTPAPRDEEEGTVAVTRNSARDATPRADDLEAGD